MINQERTLMQAQIVTMRECEQTEIRKERFFRREPIYKHRER